jgi:hypothetical protein
VIQLTRRKGWERRVKREKHEQERRASKHSAAEREKALMNTHIHPPTLSVTFHTQTKVGLGRASLLFCELFEILVTLWEFALMSESALSAIHTTLLVVESV